MLAKEPAFRISANEIFNHSFLKNSFFEESFMKVPEENEVLVSYFMNKLKDGYLMD